MAEVQMIKRGKYRRSNEAERARVLNTFSWWYGEMAKEGRVTYLSSGQVKRHSVPDDVTRGPVDTLWQAKRDRPHHFRAAHYRDGSLRVDAHGVETRPDLESGPPRGFSPFPQSSYRDTEAEKAATVRLIRVNEGIRHISSLCFEARLVLEMDRAMWPYPAIAEEIGCGEVAARTFLEVAVAHYMSWQRLTAGWRDLTMEPERRTENGYEEEGPGEAESTGTEESAQG